MTDQRQIPKILIVDDEPFLLECIIETLERQLTAKIYGVDNSSDALHYIDTYPIDLMLTDFNLKSQLNGVQLCKYLLEKQPRAKSIIMTGGLDNTENYTTIAKPFKLTDLHTLIQSYFN